MNMKQQSCDGRGARSALFGVAMRTKRRVRAAHARPTPTSFDILKNGPKNIHAGESAANFSYSTSAATKPSIKAVFRKFLTKQRRRFIAGRIRALVKHFCTNFLNIDLTNSCDGVASFMQQFHM